MNGCKEPMHFNDYAKVIIDRLIEFQNEGHGTVFFEISGHVQSMHVRVFAPVWVENMEPSFSDYVYVSTEDEDEYVDEYVNAFVDKVIRFLDSVKTTQPV